MASASRLYDTETVPPASNAFVDFYATLLDSKFSYAPLDPRSNFMPLPSALGLGRVFLTREARSRAGAPYRWGAACVMVDLDGVVLGVPNDTRPNVHVNAITKEIYVERSGMRWKCVPVTECEGRRIAYAQCYASCSARSLRCD